MIKFVNIHKHSMMKAKEVGVVNAKLFYDNVFEFSSVGVHPWDIGKIDTLIALEWVSENAYNFEIKAIGECGLDRTIELPIKEQAPIFIEQVKLAEKVQKPLIVHCVRTWSDLLATRKKLKCKMPWIFHGYTGNLVNAEKIISSGCYVSFGKALISSEKLQEVFCQLPINCLFFETDTADFNIEEIYKKAAELRKVNLEELQLGVLSSFEHLINKK